MTIRFNIQGELGNQMFQWAAGIAKSKSTGQPVKFKVLAGFSFRMNEFMNLSQSSVKCSSVLSGLGQMRMFKKIIGLARWIPSPRYFNERNLGYYDLTKAKYKVFHGYFQSWRYFDNFRDEILNEFALSKPSQMYFDLIATLPSDFTAIHIRRGGAGAAVLSQDYHGLLNSDYYRRAILLNENLGGSKNYIVFTDNPERARQTLLEVGISNLRMVGPKDTFSQSENLHIMSLATSFIGANSSYSWWAAYLAKDLKTPPIFPRQWYMDPLISTNDMLLPDWISIGFSKFLNEDSAREVKKID
jgi:hypothetical protein